MFTVACTPSRIAALFIFWVYREKYYTGLTQDPELHVKLTGSWETTVGPELDTFRMSPNPSSPLSRLVSPPKIC